MTGKGKSRWADSKEDAARTAALKKEKELKKRLKKEKEAAVSARRTQDAQGEANGKARATIPSTAEGEDDDREYERPAKRRRLTPEPAAPGERDDGDNHTKLLRFQGGGFGRSRSVENYDKLNDIEEGAYGWVARAREIATGQVVALKRLKIEPNDRNGLPVTGLREIQILKDCEHRNIVKLMEVVVGEDTTKIEKCANCHFHWSSFFFLFTCTSLTPHVNTASSSSLSSLSTTSSPSSRTCHSPSSPRR